MDGLISLCRCFLQPSPSSRCRTSSCSRTSFCRCTSSSRATGRWWPIRSPAIGSSGWCCCARDGKPNYEGRPPVYSIGCAGLITFSEQHSDGRYNIVLRGLEKFRITGEDHSRSYRVAEVEPLAEEITPEDRDIVRSERRRLEALLVPQPEGRGVDSKVPPSMSDEDLVNALAQYLDLESVEKQALLEREGLVARCRSLIDLLEMKVIVSRRAWSSESH